MPKVTDTTPAINSYFTDDLHSKPSYPKKLMSAGVARMKRLQPASASPEPRKLSHYSSSTKTGTISGSSKTKTRITSPWARGN